MQKQVTASDVAKFLGISQSTVSRVFTPGARVSDETRTRVLRAAQELGYRPNVLARGLITKKTRIIGLAMGDVQNPFYPDILSKFTKELRKRGYHVLFVNIDNDFIEEDEMSQFLDYSVEGVIVTSALLSSSVVSQFMDHKIPIVLFNRYHQNPVCHSVSCDNIDGGCQIGEYLIKTGHKRIAYIAGNPNTSTSQDREQGFRRALNQYGYPLMTELGHFTYEGGYAASKRLLNSIQPPDAIFCANDIMALGAMDAAKELGLRIPQDVSFVGFDDIHLASWSGYSLTTWQQPVEEMIQFSIELLLNQIENKDQGQEIVSKWIKGSLIERKSVANR